MYCEEENFKEWKGNMELDMASTTNTNSSLLNNSSINEADKTEIETKSELMPAVYYARKITPHLDPSIFKPYTRRILLGVSYLMVAAASLFVIVATDFWAVKLAASLVAGLCFGAFGFFAHEVLHGSVVRGKALQDLLGFFAFTPWFISPTFWRYWHNHLHHGNTQALITDPDAFPTLRLFKHSKFMKFMFPFTPGSGHKRSMSYFFFWFSFHVLVAQNYLRFRNDVYEKLNHKKVTLEMLGQVAIWGGLLFALGPENLIWTFAIPFLAQNYFVMSYIATNHNLSPLTKVNDPLVNSLTVTNWKWLEPLHLNFGYHVEHHLMPNVNGAHAKKIHSVLKEQFADKFIYMPKWKAMSMLYNTSRIYKNSNTLVNPESGETFETLRPRQLH